MKPSIKLGFMGALAIGSMIASIFTMGVVQAAPVIQTLPRASGASVELAGCGWINGWNGPVWVCRHYGHGHHDYHPGHWDRHGDHYDYHPGHMDYHHGGHVHHED